MTEHYLAEGVKLPKALAINYTRLHIEASGFMLPKKLGFTILGLSKPLTIDSSPLFVPSHEEIQELGLGSLYTEASPLSREETPDVDQLYIVAVEAALKACDVGIGDHETPDGFDLRHVQDDEMSEVESEAIHKAHLEVREALLLRFADIWPHDI